MAAAAAAATTAAARIGLLTRYFSVGRRDGGGNIIGVRPSGIPRMMVALVGRLGGGGRSQWAVCEDAIPLACIPLLDDVCQCIVIRGPMTRSIDPGLFYLLSGSVRGLKGDLDDREAGQLAGLANASSQLVCALARRYAEKCQPHCIVCRAGRHIRQQLHGIYRGQLGNQMEP